MGGSAYGKQLSELVELHLLQGQPVQDVLQLIEQILSGLEQDQASDDSAHATRMAEFESTIGQLERTLEQLNTETLETNRRIGELSEGIVALASSVGTMQRQLALITTREEVIRQTRADETAAMQRRHANNERMMNAITQIRTRLARALNEHGAFVELGEREAILADARRELGDAHPVTVLLQVTNK